MRFQPILADARDYPAPTISMLPRTWRPGSGPEVPSAFLGLKPAFKRGAYAFAEALLRSGVGPGSTVLLPSFHCRILVESVLHLGAQPHFYPVETDLAPKLDEIASVVNKLNVKAFVLVHYFGFPNALVETAAYCSARGITLIEDCAHALYGESSSRPLGTTGHYSFASLWKFLPVPEGAVLRDNATQIIACNEASSWKDEATATLRILRASAPRHSRQAMPRVSAQAVITRATAFAANRTPQEAPQGLHDFKVKDGRRASVRIVHAVASYIDHAAVAERRRANYSRWLAATQNLSNVRPLYTALVGGVVPYAFPLLADNAGLAFHALRMAGIAMWRWEDMVATDCHVAAAYRTSLLQLPCHQDLSEEQMDWMLSTAAELLKALSL